MSLDALIMLMGVLMILLPYMGFPSSWDRILYIGIGIIVILLGVLVRRKSGGYKPTGHEFVESVPTRGESTSHEE